MDEMREAVSMQNPNEQLVEAIFWTLFKLSAMGFGAALLAVLTLALVSYLVRRIGAALGFDVLTDGPNRPAGR
jgi:hypothetical protein